MNRNIKIITVSVRVVVARVVVYVVDRVLVIALLL
jgi:hypothetical protein